MSNIESYNDIWDALADTPGEAANLKKLQVVVALPNHVSMIYF
jgi:hypothetical protein